MPRTALKPPLSKRAIIPVRMPPKKFPAPSSCRTHQRFDTFQIFPRVHARMRRTGCNRHRNAEAVPECAQLLERFEFFEWGRSKTGIAGNERCAIRIDADVTVHRQACGQTVDACGKFVAGIWDRCAAEVERVAR